jgi:hypothetical protein
MATDKIKLMTEGKTLVWKSPKDNTFFYLSGMSIDADGAPNAYHPKGSPPGLDYLANAGHPGDWYGILTDTGMNDGQPVAQGADDMCPGFYISPTSLADKSAPAKSARRYVDSTQIPYIALPGDLQRLKYAQLGDFAIAYNLKNKGDCPAIFADVGPSGRIGEGSIALAQALDIDSDPKHGGVGGGVFYLVFPNTRRDPPWPMSREQLTQTANGLYLNWGGLDRLQAYLAELTVGEA